MYSDEPTPFRTISTSDRVACVVGEIAFFLGVPQPYAHRASATSHVKLLALSKEDYEEMKDRYPESRDTLINNVKVRGLMYTEWLQHQPLYIIMMRGSIMVGSQ